ncbi:hypothetical protein G6M89_09250 [Natronolimnobius sp. AArcel1]|uniref:hypothetical protein n=1 Tax=Natronolimnobius sp. AArcel1 TaxID=1679093 RepID=UPI0013EB4757|nr:hypothetical protein [Natronolimnobius sp. AArcel1]NGM69190.1 hypothetical protein [Natronolimnobius sp. AArcel1]
MTRIAPHDVAEVLETELDDSALMAFISDANRVVNRRCEPHTDDDEALADVETYVAAHLATAKEPRVSATSHESVGVELDADGDRYWHQAVLIDPTGRLDRPERGYGVATT